MSAQGSGRPSPLPAGDRLAWRRLRFIPLAVAAVSLIFGLSTGLARIGFTLPERVLTLAELHAALMVGGFLGTLISLERAVAFGAAWSYGAPAISALGALALILGAPTLAMLCFLAAAAIMTAASCVLQLRHPALPMALLCIASACWAIGSLVALAGFAMSDAVGWWLTFLILTIAAERLELSRLLAPPRKAEAVLGVFVLLILVGAARGEYGGAFAPFTGIGLLGSTLWLLRYDLARRTIRHGGSAQFAAACILAGHVWLAVAGLLLLAGSAAAFSYDAVVHAIAIGFVLSMIFGHAPIILPAVTGLRVPFTPYAYAALALLHASLLLRVGGDLAGQVDLRAWSGAVTIAALLVYAGTVLAARRALKA